MEVSKEFYQQAGKRLLGEDTIYIDKTFFHFSDMNKSNKALGIPDKLAGLGPLPHLLCLNVMGYELPVHSDLYMTLGMVKYNRNLPYIPLVLPRKDNPLSIRQSDLLTRIISISPELMVQLYNTEPEKQGDKIMLFWRVLLLSTGSHYFADDKTAVKLDPSLIGHYIDALVPTEYIEPKESKGNVRICEIVDNHWNSFIAH